MALNCCEQSGTIWSFTLSFFYKSEVVVNDVPSKILLVVEGYETASPEIESKPMFAGLLILEPNLLGIMENYSNLVQSNRD